MSKIVFCSFGDKRLKRSLDRLKRQTSAIGVYSDIFLFTEDELEEKFRKKYSNLLVPGSRGFGFWVWKPQVVKQVFDKLEDGDVVHYADIGCWINVDGKSRLNEYIKIVQESEVGILGFQIPREKQDPALKNFTYPEFAWTKGDLFKYFDVSDQEKFTNSEQFVATSFLLRKCDKTIRFIEDWANVWEISLNLVDDSPSTSRNFDGFIEHRHDQSAFSLLAKKNDAESISYLELEYPVLTRGNNYLDGKNYYLDWEKLRNYPIQARKDKDLGIFKITYIKTFNKIIKLLFPVYGKRLKIWGLK